MSAQVLFVRGVVVASMLLVAAAQAATITVNRVADTSADDGDCTLREAITAANTDMASGAMAGECAAGSGSDLIEFSVAGTIQPGSQLPIITTVIHIDGYSAPGASVNTQTMAQGTNAQLKIEIDGVNAGDAAGLSLAGPSASGSIIEGLVINSSAANPGNSVGIRTLDVTGAAATIIRGNFLGTNISGTARHPRGANIQLANTSNLVVGSGQFGKVSPASVNLISGSANDAITLPAITNFVIRGNLIGTNAAGTASLTNNGNGIRIYNSSSGHIGDNVISGNLGPGISLEPETSGIDIEGNLIGTSADGMAAMPNLAGGIVVWDQLPATPFSIQDVDIIGNLVAFNQCASCTRGGVVIALVHTGNSVSGIRLSGNRIHSNQGLEIDLALTKANNAPPPIYGVTLNDSGDPDTGPNTVQNFPVISAAVTDGVNVLLDYSLNSEASKAFTLEFFHTGICDPSGYGGSELYLGQVAAPTDGSGIVSGQIQLPLTVQTGYITATATNTVNGTSEFSTCFSLPGNLIFKDGFE